MCLKIDTNQSISLFPLTVIEQCHRPSMVLSATSGSHGADDMLRIHDRASGANIGA